MLAALAALVLAAGNAPPVHDARPVVALLPLRPLGVPADVVRALEVTLRNELSALAEARLLPEKELAEALKREPEECEAHLPCATQAAAHAGARQLIAGTASQLGDAFMIDLKLLDAQTAQELRRATHPFSGSKDALIDTLREAAVQLLAPARFVGAIKVEVPGAPTALLFVDGKPVPAAPLATLVEGLTPGQHTIRVADGKSRETSAFVEVKFGKITETSIDLDAAWAQMVHTVPPAALPSAENSGSQRRPLVRNAAIAGLALGVASAVVGIAYHARAYATASDLNRREALNQLQPGDAANYAYVDRQTHMARGFYVAAGILAAAGGGLLWWDLRADGMGVQGKF